MADDLSYEDMVERALRGVVREAVSLAAERGLPGDHHFYITFRTDHPGVDIPNHLRERYPGEMTIVLEFQFWGLRVDDESFAVTLSFNDQRHRLHIPFAAVKSFADPSVRFVLQFSDDSADDAAQPAPVERLEPEAVAPAEAEPAARPVAKAPAAPDQAGEDQVAESGEKVVALDTFRRK